mmetsp:Transcript_35027/g.110182  ORF Transcript_35027/g.110182 Transcript_35027/m.110182 type:complete len:403 (+) Transcript_35027:471-1679(+)
MEKRKALKAAKAAWDQRKALEEASKFVLEGVNGAEETLTMERLAGKRVLLIKSCVDATFTLGPGLRGLIKVFVEDSQRLTLNVQCALITSHIECSHVEGLDVALEMPLATLQLDLCSEVKVTLRDGLAAPARGRPGMAEYVPAMPRIVHAGIMGMTVEARALGGGDLLAGAPTGFAYPEALAAEAENEGYEAPSCPPEEVQWVSQPFASEGAEGALVWETARLVRVGERFLTPRELEEERKLMPLAERSVDVRGTAEGAMNNALARKEQGNEAFKEREYMQAMALYTMAIDAAPVEAAEATEANGGKPLVAVCRANRAACFLKLGQHDKAIEDATECTRLAPTFAKGHFRLGMAHHAMGNYEAAMPHLLRARDLAPKDNQIKEAIRFCEFRAVEARRKAAGM